MRRDYRALLALVLLVLAQPLSAQSAPPLAPAAATEARPPLIPIAALTKDSGISDLQLSPDGSLIALRSQDKDSTSIAILDTATRAVQHRLSIPRKNELAWMQWAGNGKLLFALSAQTIFFGEDARISRLYYYDLTTRTMPFIGKGGMGLEGDDVLFVDPAGEFVLLSMQRSIYDYPSVWRFPLDSNPAKGAREVQRAVSEVWEWYADNAGAVRMGMAFQPGGKVRILYRASPEEPLRAIARLTEDNFDDAWWDVLRIRSGSDEGLVLKPDENGRMAVHKFNYATRSVGELVFAQPGWDIDAATVDDQGQLIAAFFTDDRDRVVWFDPKLKSLYARFEKAMPGKQIWITSRSRDGGKMLVWAGDEGDPGQTFLYDAAKRSLDGFSADLPELDRAATARPRPINYRTRDGHTVFGYLTLPRGRPALGLPLLIMPHGGPFGVRDKLEFDSLVQFLANRGYAVLQPNFRGSGGYGEAYYRLGMGQIGQAMQDDLDDAMDWAVQQGIADPARVCMIGASYGGYAALWGVIRNPERYRCAISFAGVTDWNRLLKYDRRYLSRSVNKLWRSEVLGEAGSADLDQVSPLLHIGKLNRPVLLAHGEEDTRVPLKQFIALRDAALKANRPVEAMTFAEEGHGLADPENRARWFSAIEAFLARQNPAD